VNPIKPLFGTADGVAQVDGTADGDGGSDDRIPVQQVRGNLEHIVAADRTGEQECEIGAANGYLRR